VVVPDTKFDRRIVTSDELTFLQACQRAVPFHLGGGAALAGVHLRHRLSADADLFVHDQDRHRDLVRELSPIGTATRLPFDELDHEEIDSLLMADSSMRRRDDLADAA
jgi:hypothetical protein